MIPDNILFKHMFLSSQSADGKCLATTVKKRGHTQMFTAISLSGCYCNVADETTYYGIAWYII